VRGVISRQKNNLLKPEQFWEFNDYNPWTKEVLRIYTRYQEYLQAQNALDFDDILMNMAYLLADNEAVRLKWQKKFKYIMIDEYQDTNYAQYELIKLLAAPKNKIVVVGDDDQSVYKFRGASISNILQFKEDYSEAEEIFLIQNYRSRQNILDLSYNLSKKQSLSA